MTAPGQSAVVGSAPAIERDLRALLGEAAVLPGSTPGYGRDATETRGLGGIAAAAVALPRTPQEVAATVAWCYEQELPIVPQGGGSGFAGGVVPDAESILVSLERLDRVRNFDPHLWRMKAEAGVRTATVQRLCRESGLLFPPDPGAAEQSQIGGNIATNAGGPHAFKYGTTGAWVTGLEAVVAPGELISIGGPIRKDVAGYDLKSLLIGSEGTLGIVTAAWLRLLPAPELSLPVVAFYPDTAAGCAAIEAVVEAGVQPAALEYLDTGALAAGSAACPIAVPPAAGFLVIAEADGSEVEARHTQVELVQAFEPEAVAVHTPETRAEREALWRWRDGVSLAVEAERGGKVSEDIVVPLDRLAEAIEETVAIGRRHGLPACSWGHAGDGNLHSTFMVARDDVARAGAAAGELFELAVRLGGSISGEHGVGLVKNGRLADQWPAAALLLHEEIKRVFDPKNLFNPGKKIGRLPTESGEQR